MKFDIFDSLIILLFHDFIADITIETYKTTWNYTLRGVSFSTFSIQIRVYYTREEGLFSNFGDLSRGGTILEHGTILETLRYILFARFVLMSWFVLCWCVPGIFYLRHTYYFVCRPVKIFLSYLYILRHHNFILYDLSFLTFQKSGLLI